MKRLKHLAKPAFLAGGFAAFLGLLYYIGAFEYFKWSVWKEIHTDIKDFVCLYPIKSVLLGVALYVLAILTFVPGLLVIDLVIGYVFPQLAGMLVIMTGATIGTLMIVSACRFGFKKFFLKDDNKLINKVKEGFLENETMYLLFLKFVPFFPLALVSAILSSLPLSYKKITWTTFIGMLPIAYILTSIGHSLGDIIELDRMPSFGDLVSPSMIFSLGVLCVLSMLPIILKKFSKKKSIDDSDA
jgi:uncharacterized membrane protein YdjX (TVP38/TMEM64 family)